MSPWHPATVAARQDVGGDVFSLFVDVPSAVQQAFHSAGQYHRLSLDGANGNYFAMANAPGGGIFEYLVRRQGAVAQKLGELMPGQPLFVSDVEGQGFPVASARGHNLLLIGTGTGMGPLRAVLETVRRQRSDFGRVQALYGAWSQAHLAWADALPAWHAEGLEVEPVLTTPEPGWSGKVGWVQHHIASVATDDVTVFLCGHPAMQKEVGDALVARGVPRERLFTNA